MKLTIVNGKLSSRTNFFTFKFSSFKGVIGIALPTELLTKLLQQRVMNRSIRIGGKETEKVENHKSQP